MILQCTVVTPTVHTTIMRLHTIIHYINRGTQSGFRNVWCLLFCFRFAFVKNIPPVLVYIGIIHTMYTILHNLYICITFLFIFSWYSLKLTRHPQYYTVFNAVLLLKKVPLSNSMLWVLHISPGGGEKLKCFPLIRSHESFTLPWATCWLTRELYCPNSEITKTWMTMELINEQTQNVVKNQLESRFFTTSKHLYWNKHCNKELSYMESCMVYISFTLNINHCYFYIKKHNMRNICTLYLVIHHTYEEADS